MRTFLLIKSYFENEQHMKSKHLFCTFTYMITYTQVVLTTTMALFAAALP